jgi:hypothetical protein
MGPELYFAMYKFLYFKGHWYETILFTAVWVCMGMGRDESEGKSQ